MGKVAATGGGAGDIFYAIPVLRKLGVDTLYVKESFYPDGTSLYTATKRLMESQGFTVFPTSGAYPHYQYEDGLQYDYDLDAAKKLPNRGTNHIIESYHIQYGLPYRGDTMFEPWLELPEEEWKIEVLKRNLLPGEYSLIYLTPRWREWSTHSWLSTINQIKGAVYVLGLQEDYVHFKGVLALENTIWFDRWFPTTDFYDMAQLIKGSRALYCNQNAGMAIAQGLGHEFYGEFKPRKTNCMTWRPNEHHLNPQDE